ncbi:MAG: hypothetical protein J6U27_08110, partial [Spirochaetales bacterium]|nr:hypothetical protein [Spirochaetales bacterium]
RCGNDFRSIKSSNDLFTITEEEARAILDAPKESSKGSSSRAKTASSGKKEASNQAVVDFGDYDGTSLGIFHGRYCYYLRHGKDNISLPKDYKQNEAACKAMKREEAISLLG